MPKLNKEGSFDGDVRRAINSVLGQFGKTGADPTADQTYPVVEGSNSFYASATSGLTALSGGGQAGATALTGQINVVNTCAADHDSVILPASRAGLWVAVVNGQAVKILDVYPATGDAINAGAANAVLALATSSKVLFVCAAAGHWYAIVSA